MKEILTIGMSMISAGVSIGMIIYGIRQDRRRQW